MSSRIKDGLWLVALGIGSSIAFASTAAAQESSIRTYGGDSANMAATLAQGGGGGGSASDPTAAGGLPFTGMDLMLAAGGGVLLLLAGLALARLVQPRATA